MSEQSSMRLVLDYVSTIGSWVAVGYLAGSFIALEMNPLLWPWIGRVMFSAWVIWGIVLSAMANDDDDEEEEE